MTVKDGVEGAILMSVGAASLTRERAEAALADLVKRGQVSRDDGRAALEGLMGRAKVEGVDARGIVGRLPTGVQGALREVGVVTGSDLEDVRLKLAELDHRLRLLEGAEPGGTSEPRPPDSPPGEH